MARTVTLYVYESDGSTYVEDYEMLIDVLATDELPLRDSLTFEVDAMGGYGACSFTIYKIFSSVSIAEDMIVKIEDASSIVYVGVVETITKDESFINPDVDRTHVTCGSVLNNAKDLHYTLKESDGTLVSTNAQTLYTDMFSGGQYSGKGQGNVTTITGGTIITYSAGNNTLPSLNLNIRHNGTPYYQGIREVIDLIRGTTTGESYIYYLDSALAMHTKQRSASTLLTVDIGNTPFRADTSVDLDNYRTPQEASQIINKVIINDTEVTTALYSSEVTASRAAHGIRELKPIQNEKIDMSQTTNWMDGWLPFYLETTTTYTFDLKKKAYGLSPFFPTNPDGYIAITKDGSTAVATVPLQSIRYSLDSGGWNHTITCGDVRPIIDEKRIPLNTIETIDTTPPVVRGIDKPPEPIKESFKDVTEDLYIACYATDTESEISTVTFWLSVYNGSWGAYSQLGTGSTWVAAETSPDGQGHYRKDTNSGLMSLTGESLSAGDRFRVKYIATDTAGNIGEDIQSFRFKATPPRVTSITSEPEAYAKQLKKAASPFYIASYADDDVAIDSVSYYFSYWDDTISTPAWSAYSLIGTGSLQSAPDSNSNAYYELSTGSGYIDLTGSPYVLTRGDVFRIKYIAKDNVGNVGEFVDEYVFEIDSPRVTLTAEQAAASGSNLDAHGTIEIESDNWSLRIDADDTILKDISSPAVATDGVYVLYGGSAVDVTLISDATGNYYKTDDMSKPAKGYHKSLKVTLTDLFGEKTVHRRFVKGIASPAVGIPVTVFDSDTSIDETTTLVPEYADQIAFEASYSDPFWLVSVADDDVKFKIYTAAGSVVKTISFDSSPDPVTSPTTGVFQVDTSISSLGLGNGFYKVACALRKRRKYTDDIVSDQSVTEAGYTIGAKTPFRIVNSTYGTRITDANALAVDHEARLPDAEEGAKKDWTKGLDEPTAEVRFNTTTETWQYTDGLPVASPVYYDFTVAASGTPSETWTINNDNTDTQYIKVVFDTNAAGTDGILRLDKTNNKFEISVDGEGSWTDIATGVTDQIAKTVSGDDWRLYFSASDGSLILDQDAITEYFKYDATSDIFVFASDLRPDTDASGVNLGAATKRYEFGHIETLKVQDIQGHDGTSDLWDITYDGTNTIAFPTNVAFGFKAGT
jgi:hypothetical protein